MTPFPILSLQYLEPSSNLSELDQKQVVGRLRAAFNRLPFTHLLIGWNVPGHLLEACRGEAQRLGIHFLRWQPMLTLDSTLHPDPGWRVRGPMGYPIDSYQGSADFTFSCPNHPAVQDLMLGKIDSLIHSGVYQGLFLDRIRFPSPAGKLLADLGCFCNYCQIKAGESGLELSRVKEQVLSKAQDGIGCQTLVKTLLTGEAGFEQAEWVSCLTDFLAFRKKCIADFLAVVTRPLKDAGFEIGLDCFSPSLTHMVGQDLAALSAFADWIKLMTYAHTNAPAGLPFELAGLVRFLSLAGGMTASRALKFISQTIGLPLPARIDSLKKSGLSPNALIEEVIRGAHASAVPVLAGIELVDIEGVTRLYPRQIRSDLSNLKKAGVANLALSWDLLHIPIKRLDLVRQAYLSQPGA